MFNLLKKIIGTGIVTAGYDAEQVAERFRGQVAVDDRQSCGDCRLCISECPAGALAMGEGRICVDDKACIFCGRCVEVCHQHKLTHTANYKLAHLAAVDQAGQQLRRKIQNVLGRSLAIRHVDAGSCNACDFEMAALNNPIYDLQQYGIDFVASPRHADMLMVTGVVTRNLTQALKMTYEAAATPKLVMAVGACAASGRVFGDSYAIRGSVDSQIPVDVYVPGCPPRPAALIYGLLLALDRL